MKGKLRRILAAVLATVMLATSTCVSASAATNMTSGRRTANGTKGLSRLEWQVDFHTAPGSNSVFILGLLYNLTKTSRYCQVSMSAEYDSTELTSDAAGGTASASNAPPFTAPFNKTITNDEYKVTINSFLYNGSLPNTGILSSASDFYYVYRK